MNELKQEAIKKAYGEYWDKVKDYDYDNGWLSTKIISPIDLEYSWNDIETKECSINVENVLFRPKSLQGIENNNGWIRIESENDLPKEKCRIWVKEKDSTIIDICYFTSSFFTPIHQTCTHYMLLDKPNPPIY